MVVARYQSTDRFANPSKRVLHKTSFFPPSRHSGGGIAHTGHSRQDEVRACIRRCKLLHIEKLWTKLIFVGDIWCGEGHHRYFTRLSESTRLLTRQSLVHGTLAQDYWAEDMLLLCTPTFGRTLLTVCPRLVDQGRSVPQCRCWHYEPQRVYFNPERSCKHRLIGG